MVRGGGSDILIGGAGKDRLLGKDGVSGNDYLHGGKGRDSCSADKKDTRKSCP